MTAPLRGAWFWCTSHQKAEFITRSEEASCIRGHKFVGPYPTLELAEEFGEKVWG